MNMIETVKTKHGPMKKRDIFHFSICHFLLILWDMKNHIEKKEMVLKITFKFVYSHCSEIKN